MQKTEEKLFEKKCHACQKGEQPLNEAEISQYLKEVEGWTLTNEETLLFREYKMKDFMDAIAFIQQIAAIAEQEGHHPDLHLTNYKKLRIELSTHAIGGLSDNDFIMAAKINEIPSNRATWIETLKLKGEELMQNIPNRDQYIRIVEAQIEKWQAKIKELQAKSKEVSAQSKIQYNKRIEDLQGKVSEAQQKIKEAKETSAEVWKTVSKGFNKAWEEIKASVEESLKMIKNEKG